MNANAQGRPLIKLTIHLADGRSPSGLYDVFELLAQVKVAREQPGFQDFSVGQAPAQ